MTMTIIIAVLKLLCKITPEKHYKPLLKTLRSVVFRVFLGAALKN